MSEDYIQECENNKIDPDPKKILGMTNEEILALFYENVPYKKNEFGWQFKEDLSFFKAKILSYDLLDSKSGKNLITKGTKVNQKIINDLKKKNVNTITIANDALLGHYLSSDIIDIKTGKIYFEAGYEIDEAFLEFASEIKLTKIDILKVDNIEIGSYIRSTLQLDKQGQERKHYLILNF